MIAADPLQRAASGRTESATFDSSREPRIGSKQCYSPQSPSSSVRRLQTQKFVLAHAHFPYPPWYYFGGDVPNWKTGARRPVEASAFEPLGTWQSVNT